MESWAHAGLAAGAASAALAGLPGSPLEGADGQRGAAGGGRLIGSRVSGGRAGGKLTIMPWHYVKAGARGGGWRGPCGGFGFGLLVWRCKGRDIRPRRIRRPYALRRAERLPAGSLGLFRASVARLRQASAGRVGVLSVAESSRRSDVV